MEKEEQESYQKAMKISDEVMKYAKSLKFENAKILDIAETIEKLILQNKGKPAWPVNISINEIAAHYTPDVNDTIVLKEDDLVKIDIGVQVNGYVWDRAFTICVGKNTHPLIEASQKGLQEALKLIKAGTKVCEISEVVENTVTELGFNPIRNLSGHRLEQYEQHAHPSIPNGKNTIQEELKEGWAMAMEVFVTNGAGWVTDSRPVGIYRYSQDKPVRLWEARKILEMSKKEFDKLPFSKRWIKGISPFKIDLALRDLADIEALSIYPPLKEQTNGLVAVTEETVIVK
jgi:methionyl aminopeptidase